jgi:hypothetical protein
MKKRGANVRRRDFCRFLAVAASKAIPSFGPAEKDSEPELPNGLNPLHSELCGGLRLTAGSADLLYGLPQQDHSRRSWMRRPGQPPKSDSPLPIAGGLWDDVPVNSPIPNLAGKVPTSLPGIHCSSIRNSASRDFPDARKATHN